MRRTHDATAPLRARHPALRRGLLAAAAALLLAGCSDDVSPVGPPDPGSGSRPGPGDGPSADDTGVAPIVRRVGLGLQASGAFRPGAPLTITATALARRPAADVEVQILALDEAGAEAPGAAPGDRVLDGFRGPMERGAGRQVTATLTFPRAGYYRVVARALSRGPDDEPRTPGDSVVVNFSTETLYVWIDETGGGATRDPAPLPADRSRLPRFGSFGPFVAGRAAAARTGSDPAEPAVTSVTGTFVYYDESTLANQPVHDARVTIECLDASYQPYQTLSPRTGTDGRFSFSCSSGIFDGRIELKNFYSEVYGREGEAAGVTYFNESYGAAPVLTAYNRFAAHVFATHRRHVPVAESRFGRYRATPITTYVAASDSTYPINYCPQTSAQCPRADYIRQNYTRVFDEDGIFVTMHEYGHAFHYAAIEPWGSYYCSANGQHPIDVPTSLSCAFVEGFADFFAVWLLSDRLTHTFYSDYTIENRAFWTGGDGVIIEGAAAGFLYDLVDGPAERDGYTNTVVEESFDDATYPGTFVANVMARCAPWRQTSTGYQYAYNLDGMDQVVYCIEGNVSAETASQTYSTRWRTTWDGVTWSPTFSYPYGFSSTTVRRLWLHNFYGVTP